jgi:hypothetical protein
MRRIEFQTLPLAMNVLPVYPIDVALLWHFLGVLRSNCIEMRHGAREVVVREI